MSIEAMSWALERPIKSSTAKFVLVAIANYADRTGLAWPSMAALCEATSQDRKTVLSNVAKLRAWGYLEDSGSRKGETRQVVVYQLRQPEIESAEAPAAHRQTVPETEPLSSPEIGTVKQSQKRNSTENGTVPIFPAKGPVFPLKGSRFSAKGSQKRDTEPSEPSLNHQGTVRFAAGDPAAPPVEAAPKKTKREKPVTEEESKTQAACRDVWAAYREAYLQRYQVEPVRNAKVNGQIRHLVSRLGQQDAPAVAAFFVSHPNGYYAQRGHALGALVADAEKLRTEWATGRVTTATTSRREERTASNPFARLASEARQRDQEKISHA